jgi:hypothetical protein
MKIATRLAGIAVACAALAVPAPALAEQGPSGPVTIGFEVQSIDAASRSVTGIMHCVEPEKAGRPATFHAVDGVELLALTPGTAVGIKIRPGNPPEVVGIEAAPCSFEPSPPGSVPPAGGPGQFSGPAPGQFPGAPGGPKQVGPGQPGGTGGDIPRFAGAFMSRVWKFQGEVDDYSDGKLGMTLDKILNLPKKFRDQDDELVDQDTVVLVGKRTKVLDGRNHRVDADQLGDVQHVRVQGKLLRPNKWEKDEDGDPVATIRAKKIYIVD